MIPALRDTSTDGRPVAECAARQRVTNCAPAAERRGAFVLTQLLGLSYAEAAVVEGVPVGTIRSRLARARGDLVDALAG